MVKLRRVQTMIIHDLNGGWEIYKIPVQIFSALVISADILSKVWKGFNVNRS